MSRNHYTSIIATHQSRIRCILTKIFNQKIEKFKNGAVICLEIKNSPEIGPEITCSLYHEGELASNENKPDVSYYVNEPSGPKGNFTGVQFKKLRKVIETNRESIQFSAGGLQDESNLIFEGTNNDTYTFFLIRHGQGTHNTTEGFNKRYNQSLGMKDTPLTKEGIQQAQRAGHAIGNYAPMAVSAANFLFSSDLTRTIHTLVYFLLGLCQTINENNKLNIQDCLTRRTIKTNEITVLPCAHELNYKDDGNCDGAQTFTANENLPSSSNIKDLIQEYMGFNINWSLYSSFYNNKSRYSYFNTQRSKCRDTNFIQQAINYINGSVSISRSISPLEGGKKKKNKNTKKKRRKNKKQKRSFRKRIKTKTKLKNKKQRKSKKKLKISR